MVRLRIAGVDVGASRFRFPVVYELWQSGELSPSSIASAVDRIPGGAESLAGVLACPVRFVLAWGAGELYPGWDAVCAVAAAAGLSAGDLELPVEDASTATIGSRVPDPVRAVLAVEYRPVVVAAALGLRGRRWGLPKTPEEVARVERARQVALSEVQSMLEPHSSRTSASQGPDPR